MATASSIHSAEELNFLRLTDLLIRIGPQAVRSIFEQKFPASGLSSFLSTNKPNLQNLKTKRVINAAQWNLLYPTGSATVDSKDFDVTLMVCLLRNFAGFQINDQNPTTYVYDTAKDADISRIKFYRNYIVHSKDGEIGHQEFTDIWDCVSKAILRLAGNLKPQIDKLAHAPVDADTLTLLKQTQKELELTRKLMSDTEDKLENTQQRLRHTEHRLDVVSKEKTNADVLRQKTITEWKNQDTYYKDTSATTFVIETLASNDNVIVTGPPGCGKSAVAHHVALILEGQGYELHPMNHPSDVMKVFCKDKKQVFIIDDICGKFVFEQLLSNAWEAENERLEKLTKEDTSQIPVSLQQFLIIDLMKDKNHSVTQESVNQSKIPVSNLKVIATCRENIFKNKAFPKFRFFNLKLCSFSSQFKLTKEEFEDIALSYLEQSVLDEIGDVTLFDFFPLLCVLFKHIKNQRLFTHPVEVINAEVKELRKTSIPSFIALALLVLYNNDLKKEILNTNDLDDVISEICKECDIEQASRYKPDDVTFNRLMGVFISESNYGYTAIHDKMFDIISISISSFIMSVVIRNGSSTFIKNRMQFKSLGKSSTTNVIYIPEEYEELYMQRQYTEISKGSYWAVFENLNTKNEQYRTRLIEYIDQHFTSKDFQVSPENITPLHAVASLGYIELVKYFVKKYNYQLTQLDSEGKTPFMSACENGNLEVVIFLKTYLQKYPKIMGKTYEGWSSVHLAASNGHNNVIQFLVDMDMDINETTDKDRLTPFFLASIGGHLDTVKYLLEMNGDMMDSRVNTKIKDKYGMSALHSACIGGHTRLVKLLIDVGMEVNETTMQSFTPLFLACVAGELDTVELLLDLNGDKLDGHVKTRIEENGLTALHAACCAGHTRLAKLLIDFGMKVNETTTNTNETPLYIACGNGHYETVKLLLDLNEGTIDSRVDTRINDVFGFTALHHACVGGHTSLVKLLIDVGMNVNARGPKNVTPLVIACWFGQYNTVKLLLGLNGDQLDSRVDTKIKNVNGYSALHTACEKGHTRLVKLLIDYGMNVNETSNEKYTPLFHACMHGQYDTVKLLLDLNEDKLDSRVDTRIKEKHGYTALHAACRKGYTSLVKLLVDVGMNVNETTKENFTPLYLACMDGHYDTVKLLLELNEDKLDSRVDTRIKDVKRYTALHTACANGHTNLVKLLIDVGMNVNERANENVTPLMIACYNGMYDTVKLLLDLHKNKIENRIDTRIKDVNGCTALHIACRKGYTRLVKLLVDVGMNVNETTIQNVTPLIVACANGQYDTVKLLVDLNGDKLNSRVDTGIKGMNSFTALHFSCAEGHTSIVKLLIDVGMNVNERAYKNATPLLLACYNGHYDTVKLLLDLNAKPFDCRVDTRTVDEIGYTSLHMACGRGHTNLVKLLLDFGMNVNETTNNNYTPLFVACENGQYDTAKLLVDLNKDKLDSRVDTRIKDVDGLTALHAACRRGHTNLVKLLVDVGMNVNETTNENFTPFYIACDNGQYHTVKLLLDLNEDKLNSRVDTRIREVNGFTALHIASAKGHSRVVNLLIDVGMNVNERGYKSGSTPLHLACLLGRNDTVKLILDLNGDKLDSRVDTRVKDANGYTALHMACGKGHTCLVKLLIDVGVKVNEISNEKYTPLFHACMHGQYDTVKLLLDLNKDKLDSRVDTRIKEKHGYTALHAACRKGYTSLVKLLVDVGMNVNETTKENFTPLYLACITGTFDIVKLLLSLNDDKVDSRVDTRIKDKHGYTALHAACSRGHKSLVKLLVDVGMNVNETTNENFTPLDLACMNGQYDIVRLLLSLNEDKLDSRVDTRIKALDGSTVLHSACEFGHLNIVKLLIDAGMRVDQTDILGQTPLCIACYKGHYSVVQTLLEKYSSEGIRINKSERKMYIVIARCNRHGNIVDLLQKFH